MPKDYYEHLLEQITNIRANNNIYWMDILKLAFKHAPKEARVLMKRISSNDEKITKVTKRLGEIGE